LIKALEPLDKLKFFEGFEILAKWPKFKFGDDPWMKDHVKAFRDCEFDLPAPTESDKKENEEKTETGKTEEEENQRKRCQEMSWSPWDVAAYAIRTDMWVWPGEKAPTQPESAAEETADTGPDTTKGPDGTVTMGEKKKTFWEKLFGSDDDKSTSTMNTPSVLIAVVVVSATVAISFYIFAN